MKYCIHCGAPVEDNAKFCTECGGKQELQDQPDNTEYTAQGAAGAAYTGSNSQQYTGPKTHRETKQKSHLNESDGFLVGDERIELPQVESESTALPLCKSPIFCCVLRGEPLNVCYYTGKARSCQAYF